MPPSFANDAAPPELDDFIVKALNKKREHRYQSCGELADALGQAFGLTGNHLDWAKTPESEIAKQLQANAGRGGAMMPAPAGAAPAAAMPFPMSTAATAQPMPFPMANNAPMQQQQQQRPMSMGGYGGSDDVPLDYSPVKKTPMALYAAIIAAFLVVGGVIAFFATK
jgi:hypothetical protein